MQNLTAEQNLEELSHCFVLCRVENLLTHCAPKVDIESWKLTSDFRNAKHVSVVPILQNICLFLPVNNFEGSIQFVGCLNWRQLIVEGFKHEASTSKCNDRYSVSLKTLPRLDANIIRTSNNINVENTQEGPNSVLEQSNVFCLLLEIFETPWLRSIFDIQIVLKFDNSFTEKTRIERWNSRK